jgi:hypothetical protein
MKINEVVNEAWGMGYDPRTGQAKGVLGRLASDLVGADNYASTANYLKSRGDAANMKKLATSISNSPPEELAGTVKNEPSKLEKQFELIDADPPTVQFKNDTFQRDQYGKWINFKTGKEVPERFTAILDRISPPAVASAPGGDLPVGAVGNPNAAPRPSRPAPTGQPAVWKSNRAPDGTPASATPPVASAPSAPAQSKAKLARMPDGSTVVTDKENKRWTKPAGQEYWTDQTGAIYRPGSDQNTRLNTFVTNLAEQKRRSLYNKQ